MNTYPTYHKQELCCFQVNYLKRLSDTKAEFIGTRDGVVTQRSALTAANTEEFETRLRRYQPCAGDIVEELLNDNQ